MISEYVQAALDEAEYDWMTDSGEYFVAPPSIPGAWATGETVEAARRELREVVEDMILISARTGHMMPEVGGISLEPHEHNAAAS